MIIIIIIKMCHLVCHFSGEMDVFYETLHICVCRYVEYIA